ncbi:MAG: shikimate dehydrogenase, partial [Candidatus Dormibacteraeota bacterium]|nr:shikimate dehydrogenase [Candidatus Dormibacteraeota bacterium]
AVVFGSGGAAAAVSLALSRVPLRSLTIVARTLSTGRTMAARAAAGLRSTEVPWALDSVEPALSEADIVVNATPAALDELPLALHLLRRSCTVADVRYRPRPVDVVEAAEAVGLRAADGVEMLLHQGMLAFELWTQEAAPWEEARAALSEALAQ